MTLSTRYDIISRHEAETGSRDSHVLMNAYTWASIVREYESRMYIVSPPASSKDGSVAQLFGVPIFLNVQVPNEAAYPMVGSAPGVQNESRF
jgi:hypothetical protein